MCLDIVASDSFFSTSNTVPSVLAHIVGVRKHVKNVLLLIRLALMEPEEDATDERQDSNSRVVPDQQRILGQRHKCLTKRVGEGGHEMPVRGD